VTHSPYARAPDLTVTLSRIAVQYLTLIFHQHTDAKDVITSKKIQIPNFMKIRPVGTELFHSDRLSDGPDEANGQFSNLRSHQNKRFIRIDRSFCPETQRASSTLRAVKSSYASAESGTRPTCIVSREGGKRVLKMKENL
jgi:hypothetical protein